MLTTAYEQSNSGVVGGATPPATLAVATQSPAWSRVCPSAHLATQALFTHSLVVSLSHSSLVVGAVSSVWPSAAVPAPAGFPSDGHATSSSSFLGGEVSSVIPVALTRRFAGSSYVSSALPSPVMLRGNSSSSNSLQAPGATSWPPARGI